MTALFDQTYIDERIITLRLIISLILGGLIGLERESRRQQAGLRTHILICVGSTLLMLLSIYIPQTFNSFQNGDPGRIAAQVITGIGFLGGGAILKLGSNVRGLTTAASIWAVAAVGLTVGAGLYIGSFIATIIILFVLVILERVENRFFPEMHLKTLQIYFRTPQLETDDVFDALKRFGIEVQSVNITQSNETNTTQMKLYIHVPAKLEVQNLYHDLNTIERISQIEISQDY